MRIWAFKRGWYGKQNKRENWYEIKMKNKNENENWKWGTIVGMEMGNIMGIENKKRNW
jgi:hypothetical protein